MKVFFVFLALVSSLLFTACQKKETQINFIKENSAADFQTVFVNDHKVKGFEHLEISLIDGDKNNVFDYINISCNNTSQNNGCKIKKEVAFTYFGDNFNLTFSDSFRQGILVKSDKIDFKPDVKLTDDFGGVFVSTDTRDSVQLKEMLKSTSKYKLVKNWAPYCPPCVESLKLIEKNKLYSDKADLIFLVDHAFKDDIDEYFSKIEDRVKIYFVNYDSAKEQFCFGYFPNALLFGKDGKYVKHCYGGLELLENL